MIIIIIIDFNDLYVIKYLLKIYIIFFINLNNNNKKKDF